MTVLANGALPIRRCAALSLVLAGASAGCAAGPARPAGEPGAPARILYHLAPAPSAARTVTLRPGRIAAGTGVSGLTDVRLYLGSIGSLDSEQAARLALVLQAVRDSAASPVLDRHRRLLLDIDGSYFQSSSLADARLYRYALTELGYTETVLIPIDRRTLETLTNAEVVTGRVGDWLSFELSRRDLAGLRDFLEALPEERAAPPAQSASRMPWRIGT